MADVLEHKISRQEFLEMDFPEDGFIYELINGALMKRSSPNPPHQAVSIRLSTRLQIFVEEKKNGRAFTAPLDVFFGEENCVQPDILFIARERDFIIDANQGITGAPDLVVEVLSPGTVRRDRVDKKDLYERFAVQEYWIVDPDHQTVEIYTMQEHAYVLHAFLEQDGAAASTVLPGFEVPLQDLFE